MIRLGTCPKHGPWTRRDDGDEMTCPGYYGKEFTLKPCGLPDVTEEMNRKNQEAEQHEQLV